jgi:sulfate adenylyltransferase subunit 2
MIAPDAVLNALEAEAIHIFRETAGAFRRPVLLYSIGKDSSVLLHLAVKAFAPGKVPFTVLHIDTTWKFREMIDFRDRTAAELGLDLRVHTNEEGRAEGVTPFTHGTHEYTRIMKTVALRQALTRAATTPPSAGPAATRSAPGQGARLLAARARPPLGAAQAAPEFWRTANTQLSEGQTMRVFPMSNWTELDVWRYIQRENLEVVPLYFAKERPVVDRDGQLIMVDDDRYPLKDGEQPRCAASGSAPSAATRSPPPSSPRGHDGRPARRRCSSTGGPSDPGRLIDGEGGGSMESKKTEGYF